MPPQTSYDHVCMWTLQAAEVRPNFQKEPFSSELIPFGLKKVAYINLEVASWRGCGGETGLVLFQLKNRERANNCAKT